MFTMFREYHRAICHFATREGTPNCVQGTAGRGRVASVDKLIGTEFRQKQEIIRLPRTAYTLIGRVRSKNNCSKTLTFK